MPLPTVLINRFFELAVLRNFRAAEIVLTQIQQRLPKGEWYRGYYMALNGILLGLQNQDLRCFVNKMSDLKQYREEFLRHSENRLHAEYDRGFFAAWADFCRKGD